MPRRQRRPISTSCATTRRHIRTCPGSSVKDGRWTHSRSGLATADLLDSVVPDRPVFLDSIDGHSAWVNSVALGLAGIGPDTPDPRAGRIERYADGTPMGTLQEAANELVERLLPPTTAAEREAALLRGQAFLHRCRHRYLAGCGRRSRRPGRVPRDRRPGRTDREGGAGPPLGAGSGRGAGGRACGAPPGRGGRGRRSAPGTHGQDLPGRCSRERHRGDARAVPRRQRQAGAPTGVTACSGQPRCATCVWHWMRPGSRCMHTPSVTGLCARSWTH